MENASGVVYRAAATDPEGSAVTYSATGGADLSRFVFNAATQQLRFAAQPNFEAPSDANGDNIYRSAWRPRTAC